MVQILPAKPSFGTGFSPSFQTNLQKSLDRFLGAEAQKEEAQIKAQAAKEKAGVTAEQDIETQSIINDYFGPDFARVWGVQTEGGKTNMIQAALEKIQRGGDVGEIITKYEKAGGKWRAPEEVEEVEIDQIDEVDIEEKIPEKRIGRTEKEEVARIGKQEERSFQRNKDYLERLSKVAQDLPKEKLSLQQMKGALEDNDLGSLRNVVSEITGAQWLKSASAQVLNSASKQFLLSSLSGITGRPNQFLEQSITKALISPLYKKEANQLIYEGLEGLHDLKVREIEIAEELEEKYISKGEEPPRNFQKLIRDKLKKEAKAFEDNYEARVKELLSSKDDHVVLISPEGKKGSVPKDQVSSAIKQGYSRVD